MKVLALNNRAERSLKNFFVRCGTIRPRAGGLYRDSSKWENPISRGKRNYNNKKRSVHKKQQENKTSTMKKAALRRWNRSCRDKRYSAGTLSACPFALYRSVAEISNGFSFESRVRTSNSSVSKISVPRWKLPEGFTTGRGPLTQLRRM